MRCLRVMPFFEELSGVYSGSAKKFMINLGYFNPVLLNSSYYFALRS